MSEIDLATEYPVTYIGPTWQRTEDGKTYRLPEKTLGWEIAGWCSEYLCDPNSPEDDPRPFRFTNEQMRFILWWYEVDDTGRFVSRSSVFQRLKGWGKDPMLAVISLVEFVGPSRFSHWGDDGEPVGKPHGSAWVQVVATSQSQTTNTFELFPRLMSDQFKAHYNVTPGAELIRGNGGRCRIQAVTSSYRSLEGGRITFTLLNETQHWVQGNGGIKMFETIQSNATKGGNRMVSITNAFLPGEDSVAEKQRLAYEDVIEGRAPDTGFLYDSIEAHPGTPMTPEGVRYVIPLLRGDSVWLNPEDVIAEVMKTDTPVARSRRMWFNQILASEDALYQQDDWDKLAVNTNPLRPGDEIVLGFDGGKSFDATALVAIRVKDSYVQPLLIEERPSEWARDDYWEVDREKVDSVVHHAFRTYKVSAMYADVALWESYLANWAAEYGRSAKVKSSASRDGNPFAWNMAGGGRRVTASHELLMQTIFDEGLKHGPNVGLNASLRRHLLNARRMETSTGVSFGKESRRSPKKVDAYAALMLANQALTDLRIKANPERERTGRAWFI